MKEIVGFPMYTLSVDGTVYSRYIKGGQGRIGEKLNPLVQVLDGTGYYIVSLINQDGKFKKSIHRLLAEHYIPNPENKAHVNHIDGCKTNNAIENLEWATPLENAQHAAKMGLIDERTSASQVPVCQMDLNSGELIQVFESFRKAEESTGIAYPNISKVCRGIRKHAGGFSWKYM